MPFAGYTETVALTARPLLQVHDDFDHAVSAELERHGEERHR